MCRFFYSAAAVAASLAIAYVVTFPTEWGTLQNSAREAAGVNTIVNRVDKRDRLQSYQGPDEEGPIIATVEVIGLRDAAVVYRARNGRVLFRTDPLSNMTVVAKGVALPSVTIRDSWQSTVQPMPADLGTAPTDAASPAVAREKQPKVLEGCDPAFSPLVGSTHANYSGRCLASNTSAAKFASARL